MQAHMPRFMLSRNGLCTTRVLSVHFAHERSDLSDAAAGRGRLACWRVGFEESYSKAVTKRSVSNFCPIVYSYIEKASFTALWSATLCCYALASSSTTVRSREP